MSSPPSSPSLCAPVCSPHSDVDSTSCICGSLLCSSCSRENDGSHASTSPRGHDTSGIPTPIHTVSMNEIIGDSQKVVDIHTRAPLKHICVLDVDREWTIESLHHNELQQNNDDANKQENAQPVVYPHDADIILRQLYPTATVEVLYLRPNVRQSLSAIRRRKHTVDVFINLYDRADETGQKIVEYMEQQGLAFTGAGGRFYDPTRMELKRLCRYNHITTPAFALAMDNNVEHIVDELGGYPLFVKPEHGYDSVGIDEKSLVENDVDFKSRVEKIIDEFGCALVEQYILGREFSVLVAGNKHNIQVFHPVEYCFPKDRQPVNSNISGPPFITFQDKWGANFENRWYLYEEKEGEEGLINELKQVAEKLYLAFDGEGLARFDIRQDMKTKKLHVLDCNPNPSLFYKDECTADTIIRLVQWGKPKFMQFLIDHALERQRRFHTLHAYVVKYSEHKGFSLHAARNLKAGDLVYSDEESPIRLITRHYAEQHWSPSEMDNFDAYAWPLGSDVYAIWDQESSKWKPINHSCDPNTWMEGLQVKCRRDVAEGEELTLDYATFEPSHPPFNCWCGALTCRKQVKPNEYKEEWFQQRYGTHVSPYILMLIGREKIEQERAERESKCVCQAKQQPACNTNTINPV